MNIEEFIKKIPFSTGCSVIKFDESGLIAINKKAGRASHPNPKERLGVKPPMIRAPYNFKEEYFSWQTEDGEKLRLWLINRLDSPTSGVILASTNQETAKLAKEAFKNKNVIKIYKALCKGSVVPKRGTWTDIMSPERHSNFVRSTVSSHGNKAITDFDIEQLDENKAGISLVKLSPRTGLTHQLRVQCAKRHIPILGDATYGDFRFNKLIRNASKINRLFLHCSYTELEIEVDKKKIHFCAEAPLPESFDKILRYDNNIAKNFRII